MQFKVFTSQDCRWRKDLTNDLVLLENIIWLQFCFATIEMLMRGDDSDVDIDDTMWSEKNNTFSQSQWLNSLQGYWPMTVHTECNTCTVMCSEPNKFMEVLADVIAKLEFYHTTWSMELPFPLIRRLYIAPQNPETQSMSSGQYL